VTVAATSDDDFRIADDLRSDDVEVALDRRRAGRDLPLIRHRCGLEPPGQRKLVVNEVFLIRKKVDFLERETHRRKSAIHGSCAGRFS